MNTTSLESWLISSCFHNVLELEAKESKEKLQEKFESPMRWIGFYIAAASLVCSVAMAADVIHGIRRKKLWFPCKFFTMNAASLTVLAVAMKLSVDITTGMWGQTDRIAKLSSTVFMITVMGNFLTSFASMDNNAIFLNIMALGILVITIAVNIFIQIHTGAIDTTGIVASSPVHTGAINTTGIVVRSPICDEEIFMTISMLVLFVTLSFSVLTIPTTKRYLELRYNELHNTTSNGGKLEETGKFTNQKLKEVVEKYWVMAETNDPQFVMARSVTSATSGLICLLAALTLVVASSRFMKTHDLDIWGDTSSTYQQSTSWILLIQCIGVAVGTVAPTFRWLTAISFNCINLFSNSHQKEFKFVENYWIQRLVAWKEKPLPIRIRCVKCRKVIQRIKNLVLNLCIGIQFGIVVASKLVLYIPIVFVLPLFSCYYYCCRRWKRNRVSEFGASTNHENSEPESSGSEVDLSNYVLQLEGEAKLPKKILKNMCGEMHQVIQGGRRQQPKYLKELLQKSNNSFNGVVEFDSSQVPNCWTLPVVTLTSIAIALPNIENHTVDKLIRSVSEGLLYTGLVEERLISKGDDLVTMKQAADVVWVGIELYRKWLDNDFRKLDLKGKTTKDTLQTLAGIAEKIGIKYQGSMTGSSKVVAANSMFRISQTILKDYESNAANTDEKLFEQLSIVIADILGACLTNLPRVIVLKCYCSAIEEREKSMRHAARLLGETEEILEILRHHQLPSLNSDQMGYIDEWCTFMMQENPPSVVPSSTNEVAASVPGEIHIAVGE